MCDARGDTADGNEFYLRMRPQEVALRAPGDNERGSRIVRPLDFVGADVYVHVAPADAVCVVGRWAADDVTGADGVGVHFPPGRLHLVDTSGRRMGTHRALVAVNGVR